MLLKPTEMVPLSPSSVDATRSQKPLSCAGTSDSTAQKNLWKNRSHRPLTPHPKAHTKQELTWIKNCIKRNPKATLIEIFYKLKTNKGYDRHPCSLFRILRKLDFFKSPETKQKPYVPKPYDTPTKLGIKWQMDVKYVPTHCYIGKLPDKFYQYTVIDEASRERFIFPFKEQSSHSTVQFLKMAIKHFGYKPKIIQTDNGFEFTHFKETKQVPTRSTLSRAWHWTQADSSSNTKT